MFARSLFFSERLHGLARVDHSLELESNLLHVRRRISQILRKKTLSIVSVLLFFSRKIFHEGWVEDPLKRIFTRVEKKNFAARRRKPEEL